MSRPTSVTLAGLLCAAALGLGACSSTPSSVLPADLLLQRDSDPRAYEVLWPGDVVTVRHRTTPELDATVTVRPDGGIQIPLAGEIDAAGRTPSELEELIEERCASEVRTPAVTVIVTDYLGRTVHVGGQVANPGPLVLTRPLDLLEALMAAGGALDSADLDTIILLRRFDDRNDSGEAAEYRGFRFDAEALLAGDPEAHNVRLLPADIVYVPRSGIANVNLWVDQYVRQNIPFNVSVRPDIGVE